MYWFVNTITDKPGWETKVFDDAVVAKWKAELDEFAARGAAETGQLESGDENHHLAYPPIARGFSDAMWAYCLQELRDKAKVAKESSGFVSLFDGAACVVKSDRAVSEEIKAGLRALAAKLEDVPAEDRDWHPGSDDKVLDLVHPSLWPLVYGKTRIAAVGSLADTCASYASGNTIPPRISSDDKSSSDRLYSEKFQWLPADVDIDELGNATFVSYINNLHPIEYKEHYATLERLLTAALPALDAVYTRTVEWESLHRLDYAEVQKVQYSRSRIAAHSSNRQCTTPDHCLLKSQWGCGEYHCPEDFLSLDDEDEWDRNKRWFEATHPVAQPEPVEYAFLGVSEYKKPGTPSTWFPAITPERIAELQKAALPLHEARVAKEKAEAEERKKNHEELKAKHEAAEAAAAAEKKEAEAGEEDQAQASASSDDRDNDNDDDNETDEDEDDDSSDDEDDDIAVDDDGSEGGGSNVPAADASSADAPAADAPATDAPTAESAKPVPAGRTNRNRLQVIVKLANIHLTPEKPTYDGGSWHIEGQLNERICATALYYYDSENITESKLGFRSVCNSECYDEGEFEYEQGDHEPFRIIYGQSPGWDEDTTEMDIGQVVTNEGRLLVFPNVFRHRVAPFELVDKTKPGHRKIVALFLVDPESPIISTSSVPPQQATWGSIPAVDNKLPPEIAQLVYNDLGCPYPLSEAKKLRAELIEERKAIEEVVGKTLTETEWCFCEH